MSKRQAPDEEEAFPRGQVDHSDGTERPIDAIAAEGKPRKRRKLSKADKEKAERDAEVDEALKADAEQPRYAPAMRLGDLTEGAIVIGAVKEINDQELVLNLPFNNLGYVSRAHATEAGSSAEKLPSSLSDAYRTGQLLVAVVIRVLEVGQVSKRMRVELSLRPSLANAGLDISSICENMWLPAVVESEEEHVYRLSFGVEGIQGLLNKSEAAAILAATRPGAVIQVAVQAVNVATMTVRCVSKAQRSLGGDALKQDTLKAGFLVHAKVEKVLQGRSASTSDVEGTNAGLILAFCGTLSGLVHWHHQGHEAKGATEIKPRQRVTARILAVVPGAKVTVHMSLAPHLLDWAEQSDSLSAYEIGQRLDGEVLDVMKYFGCRMRCQMQGAKSSDAIVSFCPVIRMRDKDDKGKPMKETLTVGTKAACRVLGRNYLDGTLIVTQRQSDLRDGVLVSPGELQTGQLVTGAVQRVVDFGIFVELSEYVTGLVNLRHLTDVPLAKVSKKFQPGTKVKCRVLSTNVQKRQVDLTAKKSLVRDSFQFTDFEQARVNMLVTGYVNRVQDFGALVAFYGGVHGLLPAKEMELDEAPALGMVVKCRISEIKRRRRRLVLSLDLEGGKEPTTFDLEVPDPEAAAATTHQVLGGDLASSIRAVCCIAEGVLVRFRTERAGENTELRGFVPLAHLSDDLEQAKARHIAIANALGGNSDKIDMESFNGGIGEDARAVLGDGVVLAKRFHPKKAEDSDNAAVKDDVWAALVTVKNTMRLAAAEGAFIKEMAEVQEGRFYSGYVKSVHDFGVIVSPGALRVAGLAPKHALAEHFVERPSEELSVGQSVRVLVSRVDTEKARFSLDLRPTSVSQSEGPLLRREAEALRLFLEAQAALEPKAASAEPWVSLTPGTILKATVTGVKPYGVLLKLKGHDGLTALALKENMPDKHTLAEGSTEKCAVLDFDRTKKIVDVSLQPALVSGPIGPPTLPASLGAKRKRRNKGLLDSAADSRELHLLPALHKPAYSVLWCKEPPTVVFVPPWDKRRWNAPRPAVLHNVPSALGVFSPIIARNPHGSVEAHGVRKVPRITRPEEELQVGSPVTLRVLKVKGLQALLTAPVGIRAYLHATQILDAAALGVENGCPLETLAPRQVLEARVLKMQSRGESRVGKLWHLQVSCQPSLLAAGESADYKATEVRWSALTPGRELTVAIAAVKKHCLWVEAGPTVKGRIALLDATKDMSVLHRPADHFKIGQVWQAQVLKSVTSQKRLDLTLVADTVGGPVPQGRTLAKLEKVEEVTGQGFATIWRLPGRRGGIAHITEIFDHWAQFPLSRLKTGMCYEAYVLPCSSQEVGGRTLLSLRSSIVYGRAEAAEEKRPTSVEDLKVGQRVTGYVVNSNEKGVFVALSSSVTGRIKLKALSEGMVPKETVSRLHPPGQLIKEAVVTEIDVERGKVELSLLKTDGSGRMTLEHISAGDVVSGIVKAVQRYGLFVRLDNSSVDGLVHSSEISESASVSVDSYKVGAVLKKIKVLKVENKKLSLGIKPSHFKPGELDEDDEDDDEEDDELDGEQEADAVDQSANEDFDEAADAADEEDQAEAEAEAKARALAKTQAKAAAEAARAASTAPEDSDEELPWQRAATAGRLDADSAFEWADLNLAAPELSEGEHAENEDDEGDGEGKAKLSKRQKKAAKLAETQELQRQEAEVAEGHNDPRSVEDFERLLLTEGSTSIVWIRYMAFHLKMSDLERARQVAERAVKHVGFAEAKERFNVWVAFMNLECTFGTDATAEAIFKRAASHCDAKQVHMQLARIHERNKKPDLAVKVHEVTCRKFPHSKKVWLAFLTFLYGQGDLEGGRKTLPKCLAVVPRRKHPMIVSKAALLEYQHGSPERGRSIFEGLLDSYPKRTDLWSVYIDAHIKAHTPPKVAKANLKEVRALLERCCTMKLKLAKMRFFFKRFLDFEKTWGDTESQELVREKAREFVEKTAS